MDRSGATKDVSPLQAKAGQIERGETSDLFSERVAEEGEAAGLVQGCEPFEMLARDA